VGVGADSVADDIFVWFKNVIKSCNKYNCNITLFAVAFIYKVNQSHYRFEVPRGFQEVKVPRLRDSGPEWW